jgi:hypothetical protein
MATARTTPLDQAIGPAVHHATSRLMVVPPPLFEARAVDQI